MILQKCTEVHTVALEALGQTTQMLQLISTTVICFKFKSELPND